MNFIETIYFILLSFFLFGFFNKIVTQSKKLLALSFLESTVFFFNLLGAFTYYILKLKNNLIIFHVLAPLQYFLTIRVMRLYFNQKSIKMVLNFLVPFIITLNIVFSIFFQKITEYNSFALLLNNTIIGFLSIILLWEALNEFDSEQVFAKYWIAFGLFINSFFAFFIQGFMNFFIVKRMDFAFNMYKVEMLTYTLSTFLLLKAFYSEYKLTKLGNGNK
ncbi:MAG: hypothetical protein Q8K92_15515 [Leadbetterella sp.]|nr:hypothetical protein [Leadbetterella sp.]